MKNCLIFYFTLENLLNVIIPIQSEYEISLAQRIEWKFIFFLLFCFFVGMKFDHLIRFFRLLLQMKKLLICEIQFINLFILPAPSLTCTSFFFFLISAEIYFVLSFSTISFSRARVEPFYNSFFVFFIYTFGSLICIRSFVAMGKRDQWTMNYQQKKVLNFTFCLLWSHR